MKNNLQDLNNVLFEQLERLQDDEALKDPEVFSKEMQRSNAVSAIATQIIRAGSLSLQAARYASEYNGTQGIKPVLGLTANEDN